jgi:drug/metabolite transporter (DMT)-like permease
LNRDFGTGLLYAFLAAAIFGTQFPIAKSVFVQVDALHMAVFRSVVAVVLLLALLAWREGLSAWRYDGRMRHATIIGIFGMTASPLLVFGGLMLTRPEVAAVVVATQPAMTALAEWLVHNRRPARFTIACIVVAFGGVFTVVTRWSVSLAPHGMELLGDVMVLAGAFSWVVYTMAAARFRGWSVLRFTTLTMLPGALLTLALAVSAVSLGLLASPSLQQWVAVSPQLAYLTLFGVIVSMTAWTAGAQRIGALNAVLFLNLVPVITFLIGWMQGRRFEQIELVGAALVIAALAANNLYVRRAHAAPAVSPV